jgi:hypothetical protein
MKVVVATTPAAVNGRRLVLDQLGYVDNPKFTRPTKVQFTMEQE